MRNLIFATTASVLILVFAVPGVLALWIKYTPSADQPGYDPNYKRGIFGKIEAVQTFKSLDDNLTGIGLSISNPNLKNKKDVVLSLYEGESVIRESRLNGQNIPDGSMVRFLFDPIRDSKNHEYSFKLSSPGAGDEEIVVVFIARSVPDWIGELVYREEFLEGGLPMVTYHKPSTRAQMVLEIYSNLLARLLPLHSQKPS